MKKPANAQNASFMGTDDRLESDGVPLWEAMKCKLQ
jgi:hypothetical protein